MLVSEILAIKGKALYTIAPSKTLAEAVEIMTEQDVGSVVVFSQGRMTGLLTFREVLKAVHKGGARWGEMRVEEAMLAGPLVASPNMEMDELRRLMVANPQRYLPVARYLPPEEFDELGAVARQLGFRQVASGPFVRSSYHAREMASPACVSGP